MDIKHYLISKLVMYVCALHKTLYYLLVLWNDNLLFYFRLLLWLNQLLWSTNAIIILETISLLCPLFSALSVSFVAHGWLCRVLCLLFSLP